MVQLDDLGSKISGVSVNSCGQLLFVRPPTTNILPSGRMTELKSDRAKCIGAVMVHCGDGALMSMISAEGTGSFVVSSPPMTIIRSGLGGSMTDGQLNRPTTLRWATTVHTLLVTS